MPYIEWNDRRILFIHVPKTGGGSVEAWLETHAPLRLFSTRTPLAMKVPPQHLRHSDIRALLGEGYFTDAFMVVRHPFARAASAWRQRVAQGQAGVFGTAPSFSHWLESALARAARDPFTFEHHLRPQWEFLGSGVEVLHFETGVPAILSRIAQATGLPAPTSVPHRHRAPDGTAPPRFDAVDLLRLREVYARDFELFGYDPEVDPHTLLDGSPG